MAEYINNEELYDEIFNYIEKLKHNPEARMSERLGRIIQVIVSGLASKSNFIGYSYKDEMISLGIYYCCKYLKSYDLSRKNPHAYISKIAENAFVAVINDEEKKRYVKYKMQLNSDSIMNISDTTNSQILKGTAGDFTKMEEFVLNYEEKKRIKEEKKMKKNLDLEI